MPEQFDGKIEQVPAVPDKNEKSFDYSKMASNLEPKDAVKFINSVSKGDPDKKAEMQTGYLKSLKEQKGDLYFMEAVNTHFPEMKKDDFKINEEEIKQNVDKKFTESRNIIAENQGKVTRIKQSLVDLRYQIAPVDLQINQIVEEFNKNSRCCTTDVKDAVMKYINNSSFSDLSKNNRLENGELENSRLEKITGALNMMRKDLQNFEQTVSDIRRRSGKLESYHQLNSNLKGLQDNNDKLSHNVRKLKVLLDTVDGYYKTL